MFVNKRNAPLLILSLGMGFTPSKVAASTIAPILYLLLGDGGEGLSVSRAEPMIDPSYEITHPDSLTDYDNSLYFVDGDKLRQLDISRKRPTGKVDFKGGEAGAAGHPLYEKAGTLFFSGHDKEQSHGKEPWYVRQERDFLSGVDDINRVTDSSPSNYISVGDAVYFVALTEYGFRKWHHIVNPGERSNDHVKPATSDPTVSEISSPVAIEYAEGLFFSANDGLSGEELWMQKNEDVELISDLNPAGSSSPQGFTLFNNKLYFKANDSANRTKLWCYDAQVETSTQNPKEIITLSNSAALGGARLTATPTTSAILIAESADQLFVVDQTGSKDMLRSVGKNNLVDVDGSVSSPPGLKIERVFSFKNELYLFASTPDIGTELWTLNALTNSIELVKDIAEGNAASSPNLLSMGTSAFYFVAENDESGRELWRSDGTTENTQLLVDVIPGRGDSDPNNLLLKDEWLYFIANDQGSKRNIFRVEQ